MNKKLSLLPLVAVTALHAQSVDVTFESFLNPTTFSISDSGVDFRFAELFSPAGTNTTTHIILEGLYPLESDGTVYSSNYYGVDLDNNAATTDSGVVYLKMPLASQPAAGSVTSPIVGIVARNGGWDNFTVQTPSTNLGGATGASTYNASTTALDVSLNSGNFSASGVGYTVVNTDTIELDAFTLSGPAASSYGFNSAVLARQGSKFSGVLESTNSSVGYDSLLFEIVLDNITDADSDGIPDIVDDSIGGAELVLTVGAWKNFANIGNVYGSSSSYGYSESLKFINVDNFPNLWQASLGWLRYLQVDGSGGVWYYSIESGSYLYFGDKTSPSYFEFSSGGTTSGTL